MKKTCLPATKNVQTVHGFDFYNKSHYTCHNKIFVLSWGARNIETDNSTGIHLADWNNLSESWIYSWKRLVEALEKGIRFEGLVVTYYKCYRKRRAKEIACWSGDIRFSFATVSNISSCYQQTWGSGSLAKAEQGEWGSAKKGCIRRLCSTVVYDELQLPCAHIFTFFLSNSHSHICLYICV